MNKKYITGFTLIEMMIVVAILAILSAIALPSYTEYVRKGKRADAKVELLRIAQLQESYFVQNLSYAQDFTNNPGGLRLGANVFSEQNNYEITISDALTNGDAACTGIATSSCGKYTLTAEPIGGQAPDKCGSFTLTSTGVKDIADNTAYDSQTCWR